MTSLEDTAMALKQMIAKQIKVPESRLTLSYHGTEFDDNKTVIEQTEYRPRPTVECEVAAGTTDPQAQEEEDDKNVVLIM